MFRSILIPLDGSQFSEVALPLGARLARSAEARLRLVTVYEPAVVPAAVTEIPLTFASDDKGREADVKAYLAEAAHRLGPVGDQPVDYEVHHGNPGPAIVKAVQRSRPDLIVMSTHGRGTLSRFWLGSVADYVIRHTSVPVLLVKPSEGSALSTTAQPITSILVPMDLSEGPLAILDPVSAIAGLTKSRITLFHVIEPVVSAADFIESSSSHATPMSRLIETKRAEAQRKLEIIADRLRSKGYSVATKVDVGLSPAREIVNQTASGRHDLVAFTTHGAGGVERLLLGSVADAVIRASLQPVLVLRPD